MADAQVLEFSSVHTLGSGGGYFSSVLKPAPPSDADAWVWLAYDQLHPSMLSSLSLDGTVGVVLIESSVKARRRPYHQQKLGVLLSNHVRSTFLWGTFTSSCASTVSYDVLML